MSATRGGGREPPSAPGNGARLRSTAGPSRADTASVLPLAHVADLDGVDDELVERMLEDDLEGQR